MESILSSTKQENFSKFNIYVFEQFGIGVLKHITGALKFILGVQKLIIHP